MLSDEYIGKAVIPSLLKTLGCTCDLHLKLK